MQRQRHLGALAAICAAALLTSGCYDRKPKPSVYAPGQPYDILAESGDKFVMSSPDGDTIAKLRVVKAGERWEVFNEDRLPVGDVRVTEQIELREGSLGEWVPGELEAAVWRIDGWVRAEALKDGWAIFDARNESIGYLRRDGEGWTLRQQFDGEAVVTAKASKLIAAKSEEPYELLGERVPDGILVALTMEELDVLARVALGAFVDSKGASAAIEHVGELQAQKAASIDAGGLDAGDSSEN